ncbi:glutathione transport system ATP-binding protein [Azospirillum lipoferum]|uniref:Glutathione import ATP-binding protein GsiA n=1 Tax=Azospirillum lipoferum TaxID=193 RepID=A0A5A9G7E1_AZOLI|nr:MULTISPECIES: dipeptide ABC transporter ATP-binding protein [Azospirillum]KAA0590277.1 dipeptide ABC transporter ATP-binding protein [Azospirillum lipoferum]MCP1614969.1 glutathione transport system ATP-binding protein [Azospirillum lipoferum]MDW5532486.1 dipeptide ABC transporter ATP-binding protein [Azospirillum sp. NL1]
MRGAAAAAKAVDAAPALLSVEGLSVAFDGEHGPVRVVDDVSFTVAPGETVAIVGESGSGKSVTSLSLMRLVDYAGGRIVGGRIRFKGRDGRERDLATPPAESLTDMRGNDIAMVFQEPMTSLNPVFTIGDQIAEAVMLHQGLDRKAARDEALRMLEKVRIPEPARLLDRHPHQLSGGMRQRVMIAMALSCRPSLLIADEPTTALDVTIQAQILRLIRLLQDEMGMGVIFITHDMGVVAEVADRVVVMWRGRKVEEGTVERIFQAPQHPYTKALLSAVPKLGALRGQDLPVRFPLLVVDDAKAEAAPPAPPPVQDTVRAADAPLLEVRDLTTRFDVRKGIFGSLKARVHAVEKVSFAVRPGETLALVGESGCGKSTTGRTIMGLQSATSGTIRFDGVDTATLDSNGQAKLKEKIQYIFQDPFASLNPRMTVGFSVAEPMLVHDYVPTSKPGLSRRRAVEERVAELLTQVGLKPEHARRYPHEFSGGQRQRICIARALACDPKLIIADEAVAALDVSIQAQIVNLLMELQAKRGLSYLFISHDMAVVERVSHRVAVMYLGQIVELGPRRAVFENPQHPYTRRLMAAVPIADPSRRTRDLRLLTGEIPSPIRSIGDEPAVQPLVPVGEDHFVARHAVGGDF